MNVDPVRSNAWTAAVWGVSAIVLLVGLMLLIGCSGG